MTAVQTYRWNPGGPYVPGICASRQDGSWCTNRPVWMVTQGCEHEHMAAGGMCDGDLARLREYQMANPFAECGSCGHTCRVGILRAEAMA